MLACLKAATLPLMGVAAIMVLALPAIATVIPSEPGFTAPLNGKWRFKMEQVKSPTGPPANWGANYPIDTPSTFEPFYTVDYKEDGAWHDIDVPGTWEMAGYSPATYNQPDNASAFYRKEFNVPASWAGRIVKVNFDGVQNGAEIWLNGRPVNVTEPSWGRANYHESGWTAWQADLTPNIKFGERNLLALRVTKNTQSANLDSGDYFFLGGIYRPVTLFSVPQVHISDMAVTTHLREDGSAEVKVAATITGASEGSALSVHLEEYLPCTAKPDSHGRVEITQVVPIPRLWSAEFPNLYPLAVELQDPSGKTIERITRKIGIREITIKDGVLLVNGVPVKLTGMCRHDLYVPTGTAVGEDLWRKDLELMKTANINSVRTSHYPYGSGFYDLCDEMGFYVLDELPYCWCPTGKKEMEPAFLQRARETVARDKNHACVILWAIGNENASGSNLQSVADLVKELDSTRPRLVSEKRADEYGTEFDDFHYKPPSALQHEADDTVRRAKWPVIYTENPNVWDTRFGADYGCLDLWAAVLQRTWDVVWKYDGISGSFLWEWQDRAVADKCPTKLYEFDPATGIQYLKTKGVVDGLRNPRPEYYHVKMVYSPIFVDQQADLGALPKSIGMSITNRYSFTDLSQLKASWRLFRGGKQVASGTAKLALAPRTRGKVLLDLPAASMAKNPNVLRIDFNDPRGWNVVSCEFALAAQPAASSGTALPKGLHFPKLNLITRNTTDDKAKWRKITRRHGMLVNVKTDPPAADDIATRLLGDIRSMDADIVLEHDPAAVVGAVHAEFANGKFSYRLNWTGEKSDIQELGWIFEMPHEFDRFSWSRQALWSVYPDTHIGRAQGTARPDSTNVHLTNIDRPDAFDFNSTKYKCDWAELANAHGQGLRVEFAPNGRHSARGGFGPNGIYQLIINKQCSPPRDISTNVAPDFYLELSPGAQVEGGCRVSAVGLF